MIRSLASAFLALLILAASPSVANEFKLGDITIEQPWSRATPPGAKIGGGYFMIKNAGAESDRLVSATAEIAGHAEMHEMSVVDGIMKMRALESGVEVPAGGSVEFGPGGYHLMLMDLGRPLKEGESFSGTLTFEKAGTVDITYEVGPIGGDAPIEHAGERGTMNSMGQ
jgi:copper(I)-binding protein